jgi:hypothetical protein
MDAAYISALSALGRSRDRRTAIVWELVADTADAASLLAAGSNQGQAASRLYGDALGHQKDEVADLVKIYALIGRIRARIAPTSGHGCRADIGHNQSDLPCANRSLHEVMDDFRRGGSDFFVEFGEACRQDLGLDWSGAVSSLLGAPPVLSATTI